MELHDQDGNPVPIATPEECGRIAVLALQSSAAEMLRYYHRHHANGSRPAFGLHDAVARDLQSIAIDRAERNTAMQSFLDAATRAEPPVEEEEFQRWVVMTLLDSKQEHYIGLASVLYEFNERFILTAVLPATTARTRHVLRLVWIESHPDPKPPFLDWLLLRMAWQDLNFSLDVSTAARRTRNYRIEMTSPSDDLELVWSGLAVAGVYRATDASNPAHLQFTMRSLTNGDLDAQSTSALVDVATFAVRATRTPFLGLAWFSSALCVLLLAVGLARLPDLLRDVESASALLLFLPGLLSLYFVRPGEHPIATRIFSGVRVAVVTATMCTLAAGLLVILDIDPGWRQLWWTVLLILASAALLAITVANLSFRSRPVRGDALPSADPPAPPTWSRRHPRVLASALAIAVVTASLMLGMAIVGPDHLGMQNRLEREIANARDAASAGDEAELALDAFGGVPWKRMYVFAGGTPRDVVAAELGEDKVVNGEQRGRGLPQSLDDDAQLVALIDDDAVVEASPCTTNRACSNHRASRRTRRAWSCGLPTGHGSTPPGRSRRHRAIAAADRGRCCPSARRGGRWRRWGCFGLPGARSVRLFDERRERGGVDP